MGNLKDIQDITGLTSEAIFNIRRPVDYKGVKDLIVNYIEKYRKL